MPLNMANNIAHGLRVGSKARILGYLICTWTNCQAQNCSFPNCHETPVKISSNDKAKLISQKEVV